MVSPPLAHGAALGSGSHANPPYRAISAIAATRRQSAFARVELALELLNTAAALHARARHLLADLHLTEVDFAVLLMLLTADPAAASVRDLAAQTGTTTGDAMGAVERLESLRLVVRGTPAARGDGPRASITRWGRELTIATVDVLTNQFHRLARTVPVAVVKSATSVCRQFGDGRGGSHRGRVWTGFVRGRNRRARSTLHHQRGVSPHNHGTS